MIVVTGCPRSGTSLVVQTLKRLGIEPAAPPFLPEHDGWLEANPGGFYEFNSEEGITDDRYKGKVVKLFGGQLFKTPKPFIDKLIWIVREKKQAVKSYDKIRVHLPHSNFTSEEIYDANFDCIRMAVDGNTFQVTLRELRRYPLLTIMSLIEYLEINPTNSQKMDALNNIQPWL